MVKNLTTTIQVNLVLLASQLFLGCHLGFHIFHHSLFEGCTLWLFWIRLLLQKRKQTKMLITTIQMTLVLLVSQPFLGRHLGLHIFFYHSVIEGHTLFIQLGCFGLDHYYYKNVNKQKLRILSLNRDHRKKYESCLHL